MCYVGKRERTPRQARALRASMRLGAQALRPGNRTRAQAKRAATAAPALA